MFAQSVEFLVLLVCSLHAPLIAVLLNCWICAEALQWMTLMGIARKHLKAVPS